MDIQCEACGQSHLISQCQALEGFFVLVCESCGHKTSIGPVPKYRGSTSTDAKDSTTATGTSQVESATPPAPRTAPALIISCPKCSWPKETENEACPRCGLVPKSANPRQLEKWKNPLSGHPLEEKLPALWASLEANWDDEDGHKQFIALCASQRLLTYAGSCYREALDADPENEKASEYRQKVIQAALVEAGHMDQKISRVAAGSKRGLATILTGGLLLLLFALAYYFITQSQTAWQFDR
ncbi:MAG: hypothetical protein VYA30_16820 [Myxococcota bacterium]|nr:hypothetical protein [Myxococcota bacterium]